MAAAKTITILHLYGHEMNIYGDRGNILALTKRLEWRGYKPKVVVAGVGDAIDWKAVDLVFGGGGQDRGQVAVGQDLQRHSDQLHALAMRGVPMLTICGLYQLFGRAFITLDGQEIPGIGIFKAQTVGSVERLIGNVVIETQYGQLVGFENHSGRTQLDPGQEPLGHIVVGGGNDGASGQEGAIEHNCYGTYLHGPLLPKSPDFTDHLLSLAIAHRYGAQELASLDDRQERAAAAVAASRPR